MTPATMEEAGRTRLHWSKGGLSPVTPHMAAVILGCAAAFNLLGNLGFHTLVARKSSVGSYGVTTLFLSFGILAGVLSSGFQYAAARRVAQGGTTVQNELRRLLPLLCGVVPIGALIVAYPPIGHFVHVYNQTDLFLAVLYLLVTVTQAVPLGVLNGGQHFRTLAVTVFLGVSVRLVLFPLLVHGHQTTSTALVSSIASTGAGGIFALLVALRFQRAAGGHLYGSSPVSSTSLGPTAMPTAVTPAPAVTSAPAVTPAPAATPAPAVTSAPAAESVGTSSGPGPAVSASRGKGQAPPTVRRERQVTSKYQGSTEGIVGGLLGAGLWGTWMLSLVFARHFLHPHAAGIFSVAEVIGGAILFMAAPIATAYVPSIAKTDRSLRPVVMGLLLTVAVSLAALAGLALLGGPMIGLLYGPRYRPPTSLLIAVGLAASLVACVTFLLWSTRTQQVRLLLHRGAFYIAVPFAFVLEIVFGFVWRDGMVQLALGPGVAVFLGLLCAIVVDRLYFEDRSS